MPVRRSGNGMCAPEFAVPRMGYRIVNGPSRASVAHSGNASGWMGPIAKETQIVAYSRTGECRTKGGGYDEHDRSDTGAVCSALSGEVSGLYGGRGDGCLCALSQRAFSHRSRASRLEPLRSL